jgi:hypothetical protein
MNDIKNVFQKNNLLGQNTNQINQFLTETTFSYINKIEMKPSKILSYFPVLSIFSFYSSLLLC